MMESLNEVVFIEYMPKVSEYKNKFDSLNGLLNKTTLTGKISSLEIAENLFIFMDETQQKFSTLQANLIKTLLSENFKKVITETSIISQIGSLIFAKLIFEIYTLTQLLAKDGLITSFLLSNSEEISKKTQLFLHEVKRVYKFVDEIFILNQMGNVLLNSNSKNRVKSTKDQQLLKSLSSNEVLISKGYIDLNPAKNYSLLFSSSIKNQDDQPIGIIALSIDIDQEASNIFDVLNYGAKGLAVALFDERDYVITSSQPYEFIQNSKISLKNSSNHIINHRNKEYIIAPSLLPKIALEPNTKWKLSLFVPLKSAFSYESKKKDGIEISLDEFSDSSSLMTEELQNIMYEAENINEDLGDVVINGEIIASKSHSYSLNPILDNIRILSEEINKVCIESIKDLQNTILYSSIESSKFLASLVLDMIDRYFYFFGANGLLLGSKHALLELFKSSSIDSKKLLSILQEFDGHFSNYETLFVSNSEGKILSSSKEADEKLLKKSIDPNLLYKLKNSELGFVISDFEKSEFTNDKYGFCVYSAIKDLDDASTLLGTVGIGVDAKSLFEKILLLGLPKNEKNEIKKNSFGVITTKNKRIIASTDPKLEQNMILEIDESFFKQNSKNGFANVIDFNGSKYIVGSNKSRGYGNFNTENNKILELYAFIFIKI